MKITRSFLYIFLISLFNISAAEIGLLVVATGKYIQFVPPLIESAEKYFCKDHHVTYFVFTDSTMPLAKNVIVIPQKRLGWPFDTAMRNRVYYKNRAVFASMDYLFACDADMLFMGEVGNEILGERVATIHPGFSGRRGSPELHTNSKACIYQNENHYYFAGGFFGGSQREFIKIIKETSDAVLEDLTKGIMAVWHDESHWNRYCVDHPPTVILPPCYCYPEGVKVAYDKKLVALDKNHGELRK